VLEIAYNTQIMTKQELPPECISCAKTGVPVIQCKTIKYVPEELVERLHCADAAVAKQAHMCMEKPCDIPVKKIEPRFGSLSDLPAGIGETLIVGRIRNRRPDDPIDE
jgi:hypothetical protein